MQTSSVIIFWENWKALNAGVPENYKIYWDTANGRTLKRSSKKPKMPAKMLEEVDYHFPDVRKTIHRETSIPPAMLIPSLHKLLYHFHYLR